MSVQVAKSFDSEILLFPGSNFSLGDKNEFQEVICEFGHKKRHTKAR